MRVKLWNGEDINSALRGIASAFESGRPEVSEATTDLIALGFHSALDAVALSFGVEWREEE